MNTTGLAGWLVESAQRTPDKFAVVVPGVRRLTYAELDQLSNRLRDRLWQMGVRRGDRVGLRLHKSIDAVAAIFGILKCGAAYVPVDAESPAARGAFIHNDCQVRVVITESLLAGALRAELDRLGTSPEIIALDADAPDPLGMALDVLERTQPAPSAEDVPVSESDLAYILYTSGSTGNPKGVVLTHGNAISFVDWCSDTFAPTDADVFSSHAPFHFDLSILDIYVPLKHGATLVLFREALGKDPLRLGETIASERITVWYSTPSILTFLAHYGKLERYDYSALRMVFFAGEVFPLQQFKALRQHWSHPRYFNLYGPTETNVCTWYEVPSDGSWEHLDTFPIGHICPPNLGMVVDDNGVPVTRGATGELVVSGSNVMQGYWNLPERNAQAFLEDGDGRKWYRTGDIVSEDTGGMYTYRSRRDRMVKRRGYRVELGEIEASLSHLPDVQEVAVVSTPDADSGVRINAFVSCRPGRPLTIIGLKTAASKSLPPYMIPDSFTMLDALPRTSTDKVDLQALKSRL